MKIKKIAAVVCAALCAAAAFAVDIETALQQVSDQFSATLKKGTTIAIVGISSDSSEMSNFMLDDLTMRFVQKRTLTVANRANLDAIKAEMNFQLSGEVSDETIQQLGAKIGANVVIHGSLKPLGRDFNLVVQALDVTSATVLDMCRIRVEPNKITDDLFAQGGVKVKKSSAVRASSKYSGDIQILLGGRFANCGDVGGAGFLLGARNFNLFNINDTFAFGFFEDLSGSIGGNVGINFVIGPALGINIKDVVKFVLAPGLSIGVDFENSDTRAAYESYSVAGFALNITAKFLPSKAVSPFVSFQYDVKGGYCRSEHSEYYYYNSYSDKLEDSLNAFNIAAGISFNFGRRH